MIPHGVGGTENQLRSVLSSLEKQDKKNEYVVFCNNENFNTFRFTNPLWKKVLTLLTKKAVITSFALIRKKKPNAIEKP